ncbi:MAG: extracellular solute-binding protein [Kiritimatiellae bacterium]|nr:extracellular solute-binding protein [Kiritimatiellia bacterium]
MHLKTIWAIAVMTCAAAAAQAQTAAATPATAPAPAATAQPAASDKVADQVAQSVPAPTPEDAPATGTNAGAAASNATAQVSAPTSDPAWRDRPDPIASRDAVPGGKLVYAAGPSPKSLNAFIDNNTFTYQVFGALFETLLDNDPLTAEYAPRLATRWEISEDKRVFTFHLDPRAQWSDGQPLTAEDVKWTFDRIMDPASQTGSMKVSLQTFTNTPPLVIDAHTIRFTAGEVHWRNLGAAGSFEILPRHIYSGQDFNKINTSFPVVSGPYAIGSIQEGISLTLERRTNWWGRARAATRGTFNFQTVVYRFFEDQDNAFEALLKGEVDVYAVYRATIWVNRTSGPKFDQNWIVKRRVRNHYPIGFQGFAMNMRRPPFDDLRVRQAAAHLLDRAKMNQTLMHNQYFLHKSYFEDLYSDGQPCDNPEFNYDPDRARALLTAAGWAPDPQTGLRMRNGKPLRFTFLTRDESSDKFLVLYSEDLKKAGVEMAIERKDQAAWTRDMDAFNFDMTWAAWSSSLFKDPESQWSSAEAARPSGNNISGFKDEMVDQLIEAQKSIFDLNERHAICRRIDRILAEQVPYVLLWNLNYTRLLYWDKFGTPPTILSKYGDERSLLPYWWYDADSAAELEAAVKNGEMLPPRPDIVDFDATFRQAD